MLQSPDTESPNTKTVDCRALDEQKNYTLAARLGEGKTPPLVRGHDQLDVDLSHPSKRYASMPQPLLYRAKSLTA